MAFRENGRIIICDPGADKPILEASTLQCVHCGAHWTVQPGSGKIRGFCYGCNGPICSAKCADRCVPIEAQLENMEAGLAADTPRRLIVPVSWGG